MRGALHQDRVCNPFIEKYNDGGQLDYAAGSNPFGVFTRAASSKLATAG
jgi:hypothetical protein